MVFPRIPIQMYSQAITPEVSASTDVFACDQCVSHVGDILVNGQRLDWGHQLREPRRSQVHSKVQRKHADRGVCSHAH